MTSTATATLPSDRFDPIRYLRRVYGWTPWSGGDHGIGQAEILAAYAHSLRMQIEQPDQPIYRTLHISTGHGVGKTRLAAGIVSHFFDCFPESIIYTFAPTWEQIHDLLWKEIKADRRGRTDLPGRLLDLAIDGGASHFAKGRATNNANGQGTERIQGQHAPYLLFVLDEAEGVADYVYDAIGSMASGGIAMIVMLANPRTRTSRFHKTRQKADVWAATISSHQHPNVIAGQTIIPGAVERRYVDEMLRDHTQIVDAHEPDRHTFTLPWRPNTIYLPDAEYCFRVLGIPPATLSENVLCPSGRYEAAAARTVTPSGETASIGVDCARFGTDAGTVYVCRGGALWRAARLAGQDNLAYVRAVRAAALACADDGVKTLSVRVDGGGGYGGATVDLLRADHDLARRFDSIEVIEVHFNGTAYDGSQWIDTATELYGHLAQFLESGAILNAPAELMADVTERRYTWRTHTVEGQRVDARKLESKADFKKRVGRSPDDGDGAALAAAPSYVFRVSDGVFL